MIDRPFPRGGCRHGRHGLSYRPEYRAWQQMRLRCCDPKHAAYSSYGGRGITVCDRWLKSPQAFLDDMGPKPSPAHELERKDNDGNYEPGNCKWATRSENDRNRRSNRRIIFGEETLTLVEWSERTGIPEDTLMHRIRSGWPIERAMTASVRPKRSARQAARALVGAALWDMAA